MSLYISFDIETDGPCPGVHSMLSFGIAFRRKPGAVIETRQWNLTPTTTQPHPKTMKFWADNPVAWEAATVHAIHPSEAMTSIHDYMTTLMKDTGEPLVFAAYPAGFDFSFFYYYVRYYLGNPEWFTFSCVDIKTLAWAAMGTSMPADLLGGYRGAFKRNMPTAWFEGAPKHNHTAAQDAVGQLILLENIMDCLEMG